LPRPLAVNPGRLSQNEFLIGRRTIAAKGVEARKLLSTLIEACASRRRGLAISNEEQSDV
jgi:hypothetical protein